MLTIFKYFSGFVASSSYVIDWQELEEIYNEGVERGEQSGFLRGEQSGELKKARETTLALLEMGMSVKQIAKAVNLSVETIQNWISEA